MASTSSSSLPSSSPRTSRKRPAEPNQLRRHNHKKRIFHMDYLNQFNQDIASITTPGVTATGLDDILQNSQLGATRWTSTEKEAFFNALGRLGRDDILGIAACVGTKDPLEVRQYIVFLSHHAHKRQAEGRDSQRGMLQPAHIPAAVEISPECCKALEEAADDLSLRQEHHEETVEKKRWGERNWLITKALINKQKEKSGSESESESEQQSQNEISEDLQPFTDLFNVRNWLKLSENIFMNSSVDDCNWSSMSDEPPAIRTTALSDFYSLVVSVTKRLLATTLFMSQTRIKSKQESVPLTKQTVQARDVKAAVASVAMKANSHDFWAQAARRLRLDVYDDSADEDGGSGKEKEEDVAMPYDEIESALGMPRREDDYRTTRFPQFNNDYVYSSSGDEEQDEPNSSFSSNQQQQPQETGSDSDCQEESSQESSQEITDIDDEAIKQDMEEAIFFSAHFAGTTRARQALRSRISAQHRVEKDAEATDALASSREEARLWGILGQQQPGGRAATAQDIEMQEEEEPGTESRQGKGAKRGITHEPHADKNWRDSLIYAAEWEIAAARRQ